MEEVETVSYSIDTSAVVLTRDDLDLPGQPAAPSGEVEGILLTLWCEILSVEGLGVDDDFFSAGGDSFAAATLVTAIEGRFGVSLPVSALISSPTPRLLADEVRAARDRQARRSLTVVNTKGGGPPVFCVHGMTGEAYAAKKLYRALGENRRFYGFRAQGLGDNEKPLASVPDMARRYLAEMREAEPHGPYVLVAWCGGSMVVYEMAQQLRAMGESAAGLIMIDPPVERDFAPWVYGLKPGFSFREHLRRFDRMLRRGIYFRWRLATYDRRRYRVEHAFHKGLTAYVPDPYDGPTLVLCGQVKEKMLQDADLGWIKLGCKDMEFVGVGVGHGQLFSAGIDRTCGKMKPFLDRVAPLDSQVLAGAQKQ